MSLTELVEHIRTSFHRVELDQMRRLAELLGRVPRGSSQRIEAVSEAFARLRIELEAHMEKEEKVLFPWISAGRGDLAHTPIQVMLMEHRETLELLSRLQVATELEPSTELSSLPGEVASGLASLAKHVREHMHLENDVLFPRALRGGS